MAALDVLHSENTQVLARFSKMGIDLQSSKDVEFVVTVPNAEKAEACQDRLKAMVPQAEYKLRDVEDGVDVYMMVGIVPEVDLITEVEAMMQSIANDFQSGTVAWGFYEG